MEFTVYAGESYIGYLIELFQGQHNAVADFRTGDFAVKIALQALADIFDDPVDLFRIDGAFVTGVFDAFAQFIGIKVLAFAVAFDDFEFALDNTFVGAEPVRTSQTLAPAAHAEALFDHP